MGYKVHLTETCDEKTPHLIVNVETTPATTPDDNMLEKVHDSLKLHDLLPAEHLVDKGYTDAGVLVHTPRQYGVTVVGPVAEDPSWQARGGGFDKGSFTVDWDRRVVMCPAGKQSISWHPNTYPKNGIVFEARFARQGLPGVSKPGTLHEVKAGTAHHRVAGTGVPRGAVYGSQEAENRRIPRSVRCSCRCRGNTRASHPPLRPAAMPLHRAG